MERKKTSYEFLDLELLNSLIEKQDYQSLIDYALKLNRQSDRIPANKQMILEKELRICQKIIADYILSLQDEKLVHELIFHLFDNDVDFLPDVYEKLCAKLIDKKTPEEAMDVYKEITNYFFYIPSHTILKFVSSKTKSANTCLFFINELEKNYKKRYANEYSKYILNFYQRFRAVCTKEDFEKFIESGMQN